MTLEPRKMDFQINPYQVPNFVPTHHIPETVARGAEAFIFVADGIESALAQAKAASGDKMLWWEEVRTWLNST
jgi:dihydrofolate reductase